MPIYTLLCPVCIQRAEERLEKLYEEKGAKYGNISLEEFDAILAAIADIEYSLDRAATPDDNTLVIEWTVSVTNSPAQAMILEYEAQCKKCGSEAAGQIETPIQLQTPARHPAKEAGGQ